VTAAKKTGEAAADGEPGGPEAAELELARQLAGRAQAEGLALTGPGGLLGRLTKVVLEGALEGEMDAHLGYAKHDPAGRDGGNSRNGHRAKTVLTDVGPVQVDVPRDRDSSFAPAIVAKRQRRLTGVDDLVISLADEPACRRGPGAPGRDLRCRGVEGHYLRDHRPGAGGPGLVAVPPLDPVYAVLFTDVINVKIRDGQVASRPIYVILGVTADGERDIVGVPIQNSSRLL
jgi:putative transposase